MLVKSRNAFILFTDYGSLIRDLEPLLTNVLCLCLSVNKIIRRHLSAPDLTQSQNASFRL